MTGWKRIRNFTLAVLVSGLINVPILSRALVAQTEQHSDWARWRGPMGNGIADASNEVPLTWSETENVAWKVKVPGRGHSSPIIAEGKIFLTTSDMQHKTQSVLCFDQTSGKQLWSKIVSRGGLPSKIHPKNTNASPSIAVAKNRMLAVFNHHDAIYATCFDFAGSEIWQTKVGDYVPDNPFGYGSSPIAEGGLFIISNENKTDPAIVALDVETGDQRWRVTRSLPVGYKTDNGWTTSYSTPVVADIGGMKQLLISGINHIASYDPQTGKELWKSPASWDVSCGTMVWDEQSDLVIASGGYPSKETLAVKADGSGKQAWTAPVKVYEQSMIVVDGYVYAQAEKGIIYCWNAADGKLQWRERFEGPESASPVAIGQQILFTSENGNTLVIKANPEKFEKVRVNHLGDSTFASMAVCNDRIYTRIAKNENGRLQEYLYCLGK
ncbi:PQQ-like beta-propeller repeat protein [Mariniblastus sp.]|nr:PQQ-like beta-propeller repeat protein [Mariniblastus sp.]